jgi:hypothetical protein
MKSKQSRSKSIDLYSRLTLLILFGLFIIFTLVVIIIYSVGSTDTSSWIGKIQQFLLNLYPNIFLIPFTFLFGYLFFGPMQRANREAQEEQFLEKMKDDFLPLLEEKLVEKIDEHFIPMVQSALANMLQESASIQEMGIIAVKPHLNYGELWNRIIQSKERVYLFDTWLFYQLKDVEDVFQQTDLHQITLRILMLDPKSSVAKQRALDLYAEWKQLDDISWLDTAILTTFYKKFSKENLELRFHSTVPGMQIFIFDNEATVGFYFYGQDSQNLPQLEVLIKNKKGEYTPFGRLIEAEFEKRWKLASPAVL